MLFWLAWFLSRNPLSFLHSVSTEVKVKCHLPAPLSFTIFSGFDLLQFEHSMSRGTCVVFILLGIVRFLDLLCVINFGTCYCYFKYFFWSFSLYSPSGIPIMCMLQFLIETFYFFVIIPFFFFRLHFSLERFYAPTIKCTDSFPAVSSLLMSPSKAFFTSITVFLISSIFLESFLEFLFLCSHYPFALYISILWFP